MDTSKFTDEANKQYDSLLLAVEQGRKIEELMDHEQWGFYEGWLIASYKEYRRRLSETDEFVNDAQGYAHVLGRAVALKEQLDAFAQFKKRGKEAREALKKWQENIDEL